MNATMSGGPVKVGIVADEVLVRTGIRSILEQAGEIVVEACEGSAAVELVMAHRPHVLLIHAATPGMDGPGTVRAVRRQVPGARVVLLAAPAGGELLLPVLRAGGAGFLFADDDQRELVNAVRVTAAGGTFLCPTATQRLVAHLVGDDADRQERARKRVGVLAPREREVLRYVGMGMGNARIARVTRLSEGSVKAYVSRVLTKLRCDNRVQAALIAHDAALLRDQTAGTHPV